LRIVLADDNTDAVIALENVLGVLGHDTLSVHDGLQAVERIADTKPDLAILDIGMPGLNGYEVARKIRAMPGLHSVALVALTGWGGELDRKRSEEAGFDAHLTKPVGLAELDRVMRAAKVRRMAAP
jgi:CheY-like chemotaxis protein